jgi:hypothetical protein
MRIFLNIGEDKPRQKAKGKGQKAKIKERAFFLLFACCFLPLAFCLRHRRFS